MAHGWDSYFPNLPPVQSDASTLRTLESEGGFPQHVENFIGHHDFPAPVASHEASAMNPNLIANYYSNHSVENTSSDCVYQRYYKEGQWQADGEQIEKNYLPRCGNGDIDFPTDELSSSESFPPSFAMDLQGFKQDCGMLATSFLDNYSDVSSCSDADVKETRPSCKFVASNSAPKPPADVAVKQSSQEWLFTNTGSMTFQTESACPNMSETNATFQRPLNVKAGKSCAETAQDKMENPGNAVKCPSKVIMTTGTESVDERSASNGSENKKVKKDVQRELTQGNDSDIAITDQENVSSDGTEKHMDGSDKEQMSATALTVADSFCNEPHHSDNKVTRKNLNKSHDEGKEGFDDTHSNPKRERDDSCLLENMNFDKQISLHPCFTNSQERKLSEYKEERSEVLKEERKESCSSHNENFEKEILSNPTSLPAQYDNVKADCKEKKNHSDTSQPPEKLAIKMSDHGDATCELGKKKNTPTPSSPDVESVSQSCKHHCNKSVVQGDCSCDNLLSDCKNKKEQSDVGQSCSELNGTNSDVKPCLEKEAAAEKTFMSPLPGCDGPVVTHESVSVNISGENDQHFASHIGSCLKPESSSFDIHRSPGSTMTSPSEKKMLTSSSDPGCSEPLSLSGNHEQSDNDGLVLCSQPKASSMNINPCSKEELTSSAENTNTTSSPDQQQYPHHSLVAPESQQSSEGTTENVMESLEELDTSTQDMVNGEWYGEPLSREESSCDADELTLDLSDFNDSSLAKPDTNSMIHSEGQVPYLKSSKQMRKHLQPIVLLKTESMNGKSNMYRCAGCQHTTNTKDDLIEHHHCCHSVHNFQFCKTCNVYLMRNEKAENHLCHVTKESPHLPSNFRLNVKRKRYGKHKCIKCRLTFRKRYQYIAHMRIHTGVTPYRCNICGMYFAQGGSLHRHKSVPGRCKPSTVPAIKYDPDINETITPPELDSVEKEPSAELPECYVKLVDIFQTNMCYICGKGFSSLERARKHHFNVHRGKKVPFSQIHSTTKLRIKRIPEAKIEKERKHKCPLCPRLFKYSYNRARHLRFCVKASVFGGKGKVAGKYRCPMCPAAFSVSSSRYRHIKTFCLRDCINRLAKEGAELRKKAQHTNIKGNEKKMQKMENDQKTLKKENEQKPQNDNEHKMLKIENEQKTKKENEQQALTQPASKMKERYKCTYCPAVFYHPSGKYKHLKKHELCKLTGKKIRYRRSISSVMPKPVVSSTHTEEDKEKLRPVEENSLVLSCHFCGKCFGSSRSLRKHERNHRGERPYRCLDCGKGFKKLNHLMGHKNVHQKRIQCTVCRKILPTVKDLIQHRSTHLKRGMLQCPDCSEQFQYPAFLLRHIQRKHKNGEEKESQLEDKSQERPQPSLDSVKAESRLKQFQCSLCREVFSDAQALRKHCLTHISVSSSNQCPFCKRIFNKHRNLLRHMFRHTGDKPLSCTGCGKQFYRELYLKLHSEQCSLAQARLRAESESGTKTKGTHLCSSCPRVFSKKSRLKAHHQAHKANTLLMCPRCGRYYGLFKLNHHQKNCEAPEQVISGTDDAKSSSDMSQIVQKMTLPSSATKMDFHFKCSHCTQRFRYKSLLLRHLVSHTGVQPYACVHCGQRYGSRTSCLQHEVFCDGVFKKGLSKVKSDGAQLSNMPVLREATQKCQLEGDAEYKCKFCTKTFMKSRNLRRHILTHNEVKPYRCKACDSCFSRYDHLKVHQARCKGKRSRLEVCIPKISLDYVGKGWQTKLGIESTLKPQTFECEVCSRSFPTQSKLSRHNTMFHVAKLFKCHGCGSSFAHEKSLKKHRKMKRCGGNGKKASIQPTENASTPLDGVRNRILQRLQPNFGKKYKYVCTYCPRAFGNNYQLGVHIRLHTGERPYICNDCGQKFIRKDYLQRHGPKCTKKPQQSKVLCERCGGFFSQIELGSHKSSCVLKLSPSQSTVTHKQWSTSQSPPKGFSCAYCASRFLLFSQLQEHFLNAHKMETMVPPASTVPLQHHLSNIPKIKEEPLDESFDGANLICKLDTALDREVLKQFSCPECNMVFLSKAGLTGHMRVHTMEAPFKCKTCERTFWNKSLLRNHYRKCRVGHFLKRNSNQEAPLKAELDFALTDNVIVFKEGSKTTGTGVLQTNFSCKDDSMDGSSYHSEGNDVQSSSSQEKKVVQYQCSECEMSFTDGLMLISHLEDHGRQEQERKRNTCFKCGRVCSSQGNLERHMRMHGIIKKYSCTDCPKMFDNLTDFESHQTSHTKSPPSQPFPCKQCHQRFPTRLSLCSHYSEVHPEEAFSCRFCDKAYSVKKSLQRHYRKWHQKEQKAQEMEEKRTVEHHLSSKASTTDESKDSENDSSEDTDSDSAPYFPCHVCGKTFSTSESLEDHQRCHLGEKPHECAECGRCFFQASQLQQHQRMHKSEFQCQLCGRGFVSLFALRKHKHTHGKNRPYRCSKCELSFTGPSQLAEHMTSHREENFPCDICNRVFLSKSSRAEHRKCHLKMQSISKEKPEISPSGSSLVVHKYRCGVCGERFKDPEKLSEHGCLAAKERPYSCLDCNKYFLHLTHLKNHRSTHHLPMSSREYACNQCNKSYPSSQHFQSHLKTHVDSEAAADTKSEQADQSPSHVYICPVCHQCFAQAAELMGHFSGHDGVFECNICKITFPSGNKLKEHERSHLTSGTEFECTECGQSFLGSKSFRQHQCSHQLQPVKESECSKSSLKTAPSSSHQAPGEEEEVDVTGEDLYDCPICSMQFSAKSSLLEHQNKQHPKEKPFKCELCGKRFALRRYLKEHILRHQLPDLESAETKLKCVQCHNEFSTAQKLALHMRQHAEKEVGEFRCDMCYRSFNQWSLLKQHQESHVGQVVYECNECDKAFAFPHLLEAHQQTHAVSSQ